MATIEEILSQIEQHRQEIVMAQKELQNRMEFRQMQKPETITQRVFRLFNNFIKPKQSPSYIQQGQKGYNIIPNKNDESDYFKKLLRKKDIEIRKQKHIITSMNVPKRYIKRDFMKSEGTTKEINLSRQIPREAWLK